MPLLFLINRSAQPPQRAHTRQQTQHREANADEHAEAADSDHDGADDGGDFEPGDNADEGDARPKAAGTDPRCRNLWIQATEKRCRYLGLDPNAQYWTHRMNVHLRGLPAQITQPNFLHRLLNMRWVFFCLQKKVDTDCECPVNFFTDTSQHEDRNIRKGGVTLLSSSRVYDHYRDRILHPKEYFYLNGWGDDIAIDEIHFTIPGLRELIASTDPKAQRRRLQQVIAKKAARRLKGLPSSPKRMPRKAKATDSQAGSRSWHGKGPLPYFRAAVDLAGNGMTLYDLSAVMIPLLCAAGDDIGLFEHPPVAPSDYQQMSRHINMGTHISFSVMLPVNGGPRASSILEDINSKLSSAVSQASELLESDDAPQS